MEAWIIRIGLSILGLTGFFILIAPIDRAEPHSPNSQVFQPTQVPTKVPSDMLPSPSPVPSDYSYRRNEYEEFWGNARDQNSVSSLESTTTAWNTYRTRVGSYLRNGSGPRLLYSLGRRCPVRSARPAATTPPGPAPRGVLLQRTLRALWRRRSAGPRDGRLHRTNDTQRRAAGEVA